MQSSLTYEGSHTCYSDSKKVPFAKLSLNLNWKSTLEHLRDEENDDSLAVVLNEMSEEESGEDSEEESEDEEWEAGCEEIEVISLL